MAFVTIGPVREPPIAGDWANWGRHLNPLALMLVCAVAAAWFLIGGWPGHRIVTDIQHQMKLEHDGVGRSGRPQEIDITIWQPKGDLVFLTMASAMAADFDIVRSEPPASTVMPTDDGSTMVFQIARPEAPFNVALTVVPKTMGHHSVHLRANIGQLVAAEITYAQLVLP